MVIKHLSISNYSRINKCFMYTINTLDAGGIGAVANLGGGVCPPVDVSRLIFDDDDAINDNIMIHVCV